VFTGANQIQFQYDITMAGALHPCYWEAEGLE